MGLKCSLFLCTYSLIIRIFAIIYNILQYYYDKQRSPENCSSLLTLLLAENNRGACALRQSLKKYVKLVKCLVVSSYVRTLKCNVKHRYFNQKCLFVVCLCHEAVKKNIFLFNSSVLYKFIYCLYIY